MVAVADIRVAIVANIANTLDVKAMPAASPKWAYKIPHTPQNIVVRPQNKKKDAFMMNSIRKMGAHHVPVGIDIRPEGGVMNNFPG